METPSRCPLPLAELISEAEEACGGVEDEEVGLFDPVMEGVCNRPTLCASHTSNWTGLVLYGLQVPWVAAAASEAVVGGEVSREATEVELGEEREEASREPETGSAQTRESGLRLSQSSSV